MTMLTMLQRGLAAAGVAVAVAGLGLAAPAVAAAAPAPAAVAGEAPCGRSFLALTERWHNCEQSSVLIGMVAYDGPTERIFDQTQCIPAGQTQILLPTFVVMHSYVAGYGC